jgi:hypothetical protein
VEVEVRLAVLTGAGWLGLLTESESKGGGLP